MPPLLDKNNVYAADAAGKVLLAATNVKSPTVWLSGKDFAAKASLVSLSPQGEILKELSAPGTLAATPALSPGGKCVAFLSMTAGQGDAPKEYSFKVLTTDGQTVRSMGLGKKMVVPLAVTDAGEVVTVSTDNLTVGAATFCDAKGNTVELAKSAGAACVAAGRLYYVAEGDKPTIKVVKLPGR